jgi:hypothetical protein
MPNCVSSSNQNTRVFAPHVILYQDTNRITINLRSGEGYTLPAFTAGDVIRYDPEDLSYKLSQADTEVKAEVVGVVESVGGGGSATVVIQGSIQYPTSRLNAILDGGAGGKDVLFLDEAVAGGLTGTIDLSESVKIVKPVLQLAPNGSYNGVVVNYIGYKTGSAASADMPAPRIATVVFGKPGLENDVWLDASVDQILSTVEYPEVYATYGTAGGNYRETLTVSSGTVSSSMVGKQIYQLTSGGAKIRSGTVKSVNIGTQSLVIEKSPSIDSMTVSSPVYVEGTPLVLSSTTVSSFTVPKIQSTEITQDGEALVPYIKLYEPASVKIPSEITVNTLTANTKITVGGITDLEAKLNELENKINLLNNRTNAF